MTETPVSQPAEGPLLRSRRLAMRPLNVDDLGAVHALMGDEAVMAFWDVPAIVDLELTRAIIGGQLRGMDRGSALCWAISRAADGAFIGCCDLSEIDRWHRRAEIGFMIARPFWGAGFSGAQVSPSRLYRR